MARPTPTLDKVYLHSRWFDMLAGPVVWGIYFLVGYGLVEVACQRNLLGPRILGLPLLAHLLLALTLGATLVTLYTGFVAYRNWKRARKAGTRLNPAGSKERQAAPESHSLDEAPGRFMALTGVILNLLFSLFILITGLPALVLPPCH